MSQLELDGLGAAGSARGDGGAGGFRGGEPAAGPPLSALDYVVVDLETTGGPATHGHRITELAAVRVTADGEVLEELITLVNPERPIPPFVSRLTNITQGMVDAAPTFAEIAPRVAAFLDGRVFVAHNASFDWGFLRWELAREGLRLNRATRVLCTVKMARKLVPEVRRRSLDALSFYYGIENEARHRAFGDARATAELLARLLERVEEQEVWCWDGLQALLRKRRPRRKRTAMPHPMDSF